MAPVWETGTYLAGAFAVNAQIPVPAGVQVDDVIIVALYLESDSAVTAPAGFALKDLAEHNDAVQEHRHYVFWKRATGADSGTYDFSWIGTEWRELHANRISGCTTTIAPWDATATAVSAGTASSTSPAVSLTTNFADTLLVWSASNFNGGAWTPPATWTERQDNGSDLGAASVVQASAGATGSITGSCGSTGAMTAWLGALLPPGAGFVPDDPDQDPHPLRTPGRIAPTGYFQALPFGDQQSQTALSLGDDPAVAVDSIGVVAGGSYTPPVFVSQNAVADFTTTGTSKATGSFSVLAGDLLVVLANTADQVTTLTGISGGGLTYSPAQTISGIASDTSVYTWTAPVPAPQAFAVTVTANNATVPWGFSVQVWRSHGGVGVSTKTNTTGSAAPTLNLTTSSDASAICVTNGDWSAADGASRVWRTNAGTLTETIYARNAAQYTCYQGYHANAGAAGTYAVGLTAPSTQAYSIVAIEVKGVFSSGTAVPLADSGSGSDALTVSAAAPVADAATAADGLTVAVAASLADSAAGADALATSMPVSLADAASAAETIAETAAVPLADAGTGTDAVALSEAISLSDAATGADARTSTAAVPLVDSGSGAEASTVAAAVPLADAGSGADAVSISGASNPNLPDTASSAEASAVAASVPLADSAHGVEALLVAASVALADLAAAADSSAETALVPLLDTAHGADAWVGGISGIPIALAEAASCTDAISVRRFVTKGTVKRWRFKGEHERRWFR